MSDYLLRLHAFYVECLLNGFHATAEAVLEEIEKERERR